MTFSKQKLGLGYKGNAHSVCDEVWLAGHGTQAVILKVALPILESEPPGLCIKNTDSSAPLNWGTVGMAPQVVLRHITVYELFPFKTQTIWVSKLERRVRVKKTIHKTIFFRNNNSTG